MISTPHELGVAAIVFRCFGFVGWVAEREVNEAGVG